MNVKALTESDKQELMFGLLDEAHCGMITSVQDGLAVVQVAGQVPPGEFSSTLWAQPFVAIKPQRMIIFEPKDGEFKVTRDLWDVVHVFVGQKSQFPGRECLSGDAFSPDGNLAFTDRCEAALAISLSVRHRYHRALPFRAIVVGERLDKRVG